MWGLKRTLGGWSISHDIPVVLLIVNLSSPPIKEYIIFALGPMSSSVADNCATWEPMVEFSMMVKL